MDHFGVTIAKVTLTPINLNMQEFNLANQSLLLIVQNFLNNKKKSWNNFKNWTLKVNKKSSNIKNLSKD